MSNIYTYDLFVSYATNNKDIAFFIVKKLEEKGLRCFIAPRDLQTGREYAGEIVRGISNSLAVLLLFSGDSDKSAYVLREINSAVSRNKTIVPLRLENFLPSEAMEFYLGPTHWLDAFPEVLDTHLDNIIGIVSGLKQKNASKETTAPVETGIAVHTIPEMLKAGMPYKNITMRAIELDRMIIHPEYERSEEEEAKTYDAWKGITAYSDAGCVLTEDGDMIGYCDFYPLGREAFESVMSGRENISLDKIDLYELGGTFDGYIAMMAIMPDLATQKNYMLLFDWIIRRIHDWEKEGIFIDNIGAEAYTAILHKFLERFGFVQCGVNSAGGRLYRTTLKDLRENPAVIARYPRG